MRWNFRRNSEEYCGRQANNKSISAVPHSVRSFLSFQNFQVEREPSDECLVLINGCECYKSQKVDTKYKRGDFNLKGVGWIGGLLERGGGARGGVATWDWRGRKRPIMASSYTWHPRAEVDIKQQWKHLFQWEISPMRRVSSGISLRLLFHAYDLVLWQNIDQRSFDPRMYVLLCRCIKRTHLAMYVWMWGKLG